jgi:hypothetical protein
LIFVLRMFDHCLYQGRVSSQDIYIRGSIETYIYELGGGCHARVKGLDLLPLGFGVHRRCHVSANVITRLNEIWVVPQGLYNM